MILGPELITQNLFNQGWLCGAGWSINSVGEVVFTHTSGYSIISQSLPQLVTGHSYHLVFPLADVSLIGASMKASIGGVPSSNHSSAGLFAEEISCGPVKTIEISLTNAVAGNTFRIPYLSLREINYVAPTPVLYDNTIRAYFKSAIADVYTLSTQYDNQGKVKSALPYCHVSIMGGESHQTSLGVKQYRTIGIMEAQLFYPLETGDALGLAMAHTIRDAFKSLSLAGGIQFKTPTIRKIGRMNAEYQINISCPFYVNS